MFSLSLPLVQLIALGEGLQELGHLGEAEGLRTEIRQDGLDVAARQGHVGKAAVGGPPKMSGQSGPADSGRDSGASPIPESPAYRGRRPDIVVWQW